MKLFLNEDECRGAVGIVNFVSGGLECLWRKSEERKHARPDFTCARARTRARTHARTHARMRTRTLSTIYHACPDLGHRGRARAIIRALANCRSCRRRLRG
jgi:hypothetical protein